MTTLQTPPTAADTETAKRARRTRRRQRSEASLLSTFAHVALAVWALVVLGPILWTFLSSFKSVDEIFSSPWTLPSSLRWDNFERAWTTAHVGRYLLNSVFVVTLSTAGTMLLGSMAAYVLARYKFFGNRAIYFLFVSGLAFPVFLALVPLFFVVRDLNLLNSYTGLILVYIAYSLPFTIFFLSAFFKTLPNTVAEAAMIDGAGHMRLFFQVMMPMARSGLVSITIFNIIGQWAQYQLPVVLMSGDRSKWVITQGIADISVNAGFEADWGGLFAALTLAILPMILVYALLQRQIQAGLTSGAVK